MDNSWTSQNKSWSSNEQAVSKSQPSFKQGVDKSLTSMNNFKSWTSGEQVWTFHEQVMNKFWTSHEQCEQLLKFLAFLCGWVVGGWMGCPNFAGVKAGAELGKKGKNHENISHCCHYKLIAYMNTDCNMAPLIMLLHWWVWLREVKNVCIILFKILFGWFGFDYLCGQLVRIGCGSGVN